MGSTRCFTRFSRLLNAKIASNGFIRENGRPESSLVFFYPCRNKAFFWSKNGVFGAQKGSLDRFSRVRTPQKGSFLTIFDPKRVKKGPKVTFWHQN